MTSSTSGVSYNHDQVTNLGDCVTCHSASVARVRARTPSAADWDGGIGAPATYTIPAHTTSGFTVPGYTGTHTTDTNCASCHGTGNYKVITDFDHKGLPSGSVSCNSCHMGSKTDVSAYIASTSTITVKTLGNRHHPTSIFNGKNTTCVGCHAVNTGTATFTPPSGVTYPSSAQQAYLNVGCGSVRSTFSCHGSQQRMSIPTTTSGAGNF